MTRLWALLLAAALLFTVRIHALSLPSLEDAFYGWEAVEILRAGRAYTVTWDGEPTQQHPPLQFWLVGRAAGHASRPPRGRGARIGAVSVRGRSPPRRIPWS